MARTPRRELLRVRRTKRKTGQSLRGLPISSGRNASVSPRGHRRDHRLCDEHLLDRRLDRASAVFLFDTLFLLCLARAWWHGQRNEPALKRRWLLRSIAILLGIATTRPVMALFFASSPATHLVPSQFFGIAFWIGFSINVLVFELWVRSPDRRLHPTPTDARPYGSSSIQ